MRILFVTANRLGDAVLSTGVLGRLLDEHPTARATVVCGPVAAPLFAALPNAERIIAWKKRPWSLHWFDLWRATVTHWWDTVVDLRASAFAYLVPARRRFVLRKVERGEHRLMMLAGTMGWREPAPPRLWLSAAHRTQAQALIDDRQPTIALGPTANWGGKQWPAERFATLVRALWAEPAFATAKIAVLGGPDPRERSAAAPLLADLPPERTIDLIGRHDLLTLAACLERCALYVGNDSGLMHLAAAAGTPTLGLFGPSNEVHYAPFGPHCAWVRTPESYEAIVRAPDYDYRSQRSLMTSLSVAAVRDAALALWQRRRGP
ncbi:MAG: glycosyltransferase family 9 protein [Alphaproteobacteria bacterium]|nr:glycosyltransferase family 9 protein [Alphaproteobacteria bacterium]